MASPSHQTPLDIAVIGGGIAGLTLVIGLLKHHIQVTLYESAHHFGEIGAGVGFGPNSIRATTLVDPAIKKGVEKVATSNQWETKKQVWFDFRYGEDKSKEAMTGELFHTLLCVGEQSTMHRADFLDEMIKLIPPGIAHFGKRLVTIEDLGRYGVRLKFRDGTEATHHAVIGCDGIKSATREYILGSNDPAAHAVFTGKYCHRGLIPMDRAAALLGDELAKNNNMYLGHHGHILTFPVQKGKTMNVVAFSTKKTWDSKDWVIPSSHAEVLADYKGWGDTIQKLIGLMQDPDIWALYDYPPASTYCKGPVCIIGDAAHASTPHQGSGAGMAVEDAYVLSFLLGEISNVRQIEGVFKAFDAVRRERTQKLVATSREAGQLWEFELEGVRDDIEKFRENVSKRMDWIWNEDLPAEVEEAKKIMLQEPGV